MNRRSIAAGLAGSVAAALLVAAPAATAASSTKAVVCTAGSTSVTWKNVTEPWVVTHAKRVVRPGTGSTRVLVTVPQIAFVKASVTGGGAPATVIGSLARKTGLALAPSGAQTPRKAVVTWSPTRSGSYVLYAGTRRVHGSYVARTCNAHGTAVTTKSGSTTSWTTPLSTGVVLCGAITVPPGGLAAKARSRYC
ncbi:MULTISPECIES: hypothetical protein [Streptacidiphilus]|uniref:Ig-like domain-containing protein n=1 Tax=Streptacidiphilus cavernicola TaxID=3342716 RepID=A0ABV6UGU6_9ACTN|nr:hypothetical protein [Streptacidiphilus jeojiense]